MRFESSVNSYDSQTIIRISKIPLRFESSVNSYDSQTPVIEFNNGLWFESSVNSYDSQTLNDFRGAFSSLRVV